MHVIPDRFTATRQALITMPMMTTTLTVTVRVPCLLTHSLTPGLLFCSLFFSLPGNTDSIAVPVIMASGTPPSEVEGGLP
jgi:hypothetical protein